MKVTIHSSLLGDKVIPDFRFESPIQEVLVDALIVRTRLNHVKQRIECIQRVSYDHDALIGFEFSASDSFREVRLNDPDFVGAIALTAQPHVFQLLVHRPTKITIRASEDS